MLITGLSGAGRSGVADVLEDLGWFVVDNLPTALIGTIVELAAKPTSDIERLALVAGRQHAEVLTKVGELRADGHDVRMVFLDASTPELVRRYDATRRRHPLADDTDGLVESIELERSMLEPVRAAADLVIDTSDLNVHQLKERIDHAFDTVSGSRLQVTVESFGFKHGLPLDADIVMDLRFLPESALGRRPAPAHRARPEGARLRPRDCRRLHLRRPVRRTPREPRAAVPGRGSHLPHRCARMYGRSPPFGRRRRGTRRPATTTRRAGTHFAPRRLTLTGSSNRRCRFRACAVGELQSETDIDVHHPHTPGGTSMTIRVGINGFGRIGRNFFRAAKASGADIDFVAVNDLGSIDTMAHLLKYDSVLGRFPEKVTATKSSIKVGNDTLKVLSERNPADLPWGDLGVDVVVESTGFFNSREAASAHLDGGAPLVIVSAPATNADITIVYGVNHKDFRISQHKVISNASCTTNCFVPMVKVLDDAFGVEQGLMTTIHSYTGDQNLVDGPHSDLRRARGAAINIVPTSTGAARATSLVMQSMKGKLDGTALRVPTPTGSLTDFTVNLKKAASVEEINAAFEAASKKALKGILKYTEDPIVSSDIVTDPHSCVFDAGLTMSMGKMVKINGWYDNEWGYSNRLVDLTLFTGAKVKR